MVRQDLAQPSLCFCTAAFGRDYIELAKLLAKDLHQFAPNRVFVVLTDRPQAFQDYPNVRAIQHQCRGVLSYHERRFAIHYALSIAPSVMYLDADVRICAPIPDNLDIYPGITARSCGSWYKHMQERFDRPSLSPKCKQDKSIIKKMAKKMDISLDDPELKFINEFLFVVTAYKGREQEFLKRWGELAIYADTLGMHKHPTWAMALAARKSEFPIHRSEMNGLDFFDDRIETIKIRKGQSSPEAKAEYFQQQNEIQERPKQSLKRLSNPIVQKILLFYNQARVRLIATLSPSTLIDYPSTSSDG